MSTLSLSRARTGFRLFALVLALSLAACNLPFASTPAPATPTSAPATPAGPPADPEAAPQAEVVFDAQVPAATPAGAGLFLEVLDEVTGLSLNPTRYPMLAGEDGHYRVKIAVLPGSVVKYRYSMETPTAAVETNALSQPVRYRMALVPGPIQFADIITAWAGEPYTGPSGRISGQVMDGATGAALPNMLVLAGGQQTFTMADGRFHLDGLMPGTHQLFVYALDGSFQPFQQGATVQEGMVTPAVIQLSAAPLVNVTFRVTIPNENIVGVPLRLAGNLVQTGNTFADLAGGVSAIASRMPLLTQEADGAYQVTIPLPVGADFRYKYTLGDGFWNSEQDGEGAFRVRQFIVPDAAVTQEDTVATWRSNTRLPVSFELTVPEDTPPGESVSIQFNPYGWTEPIPMWSLGGGRWLYVLYSPLELIPSFQYRYCRNDQCGLADDSATPGPDAQGKTVTLGAEPQTFSDTITAWANLGPAPQATVPSGEIPARGPDFITGVELISAYHPSWQVRLQPALNDIRAHQAGWVVFTPGWTFEHANPLVFQPVPGRDMLWSDLVMGLNQTGELGLSPVLFPTPGFPGGAAAWWTQAPRDVAWWDAWFARYREFLLHHADLAARSNAEGLILGGDWLLPALPGGTLSDGSPSGVPEDSEARWRGMIAEIRSRYTGRILWALPFPQGFVNAPAFLDSVDMIYLLWTPDLSDTPDAAVPDLEARLDEELDGTLAPFQAAVGLPVLLAPAIPSADGASAGCLPDQVGICQPFDQLRYPNPAVLNQPVDLAEQADLYNLVLTAAGQREWITGLVARGAYYAAAVQDASTSVLGKPAWEALNYWFGKLRRQQ